MVGKNFTIFLVFVFAIFSSARAETVDELHIKSLVQAQFGPTKKIDSVIKSPYLDLYEVQVDGQIIYTDANAQYYFIGHIFDPHTKKDYTAERNESLNEVNFSALPFDLAIKTVHGDGKRKIAVFEDPNCGFCKKYNVVLRTLKNTTIYTFLFNVIAPNSSIISRDIWCSRNRSVAWDQWMAGGQRPQQADAKCIAPNDTVLDLGHTLRISGTPTTIFPNGARAVGILTVGGIQQEFSARQ